MENAKQRRTRLSIGVPSGPPSVTGAEEATGAGPLCTPSWSPPVDAAPPRRRQTPRFRGRPYPIGTPFASAIPDDNVALLAACPWLKGTE